MHFSSLILIFNLLLQIIMLILLNKLILILIHQNFQIYSIYPKEFSIILKNYNSLLRGSISILLQFLQRKVIKLLWKKILIHQLKYILQITHIIILMRKWVQIKKICRELGLSILSSNNNNSTNRFNFNTLFNNTNNNIDIIQKTKDIFNKIKEIHLIKVSSN